MTNGERIIEETFHGLEGCEGKQDFASWEVAFGAYSVQSISVLPTNEDCARDEAKY